LKQVLTLICFVLLCKPRFSRLRCPTALLAVLKLISHPGNQNRRVFIPLSGTFRCHPKRFKSVIVNIYSIGHGNIIGQRFLDFLCGVGGVTGTDPGLRVDWLAVLPSSRLALCLPPHRGAEF
jgi:hypothetical protein